ncbi:MAG: DUF1365 domain-containing protein [Candidatus Eisenbacteria bacterium]
MKSAFYEGTVRHRRMEPRHHAFSYRAFLVYLDLDELPSALDRLPLWSAKGPALARFRREDYLGDPNVPLADAVRELVAADTGRRPTGPIRMLAHLRYFGHCFNPVSFYYCFDAGDRFVETIVAEIENTPWKERHCYVLSDSPTGEHGRKHRFLFDKTFHVSPFQDMSLEYDWRFLEPEDRVAVHMVSRSKGKRTFDATFSARRHSMTKWNAVRFLALYPFMTVSVLAAIYWQALRLRLKGFRFYPHPTRRREKEALSS